MRRLKTGEKCVKAGNYKFDGYSSPKTPPRPQPTANEMRIPLNYGDTVPPVHSQNAGAYYVWYAN